MDEKSLAVASETKNKRVLKALVFELNKKEETSPAGQSKALPEDPWSSFGTRIIEPPYDPYVLALLSEQCSEMEPAISAMETNIDRFGQRFVPRFNQDAKMTDVQEIEVKKEKVRLINFFEYANLDVSFTELRAQRRRDFESTGNAYWEVIRSASGDVQGFTHLPSYQMRLGRQVDKVPVRIEQPILELQLDGSVKIVRVTAYKKFRTYAQCADGAVRFFKQFGDRRTFDNETGEPVPEPEAENWKGTGQPMPEEKRANEVIHWYRYSGRSVYGIPRYIGALLSILGERKSEEVNFTTFTNNNVPSMFVAVSNGQLTEQSIQRLVEYTESRKQGDNYSKFVIIEAEGAYEGEDSGQVKIDVKPLSGEQIRDALFQEYSKNNQDRIRRMWRLPPIMVGRSEDYTRATADTSRMLADEQIFAPERESWDSWINRILFPEMGVMYHKFRSNSPNTTDNAQLVDLLARAEKTGGMTPRIARKMLEDILSIDLPPFPEGFDPDVPFSLTMAQAVKNLGDATEPGQTVTALKQLGIMAGPDVGEELVERLLDLRGRIEDQSFRSVMESVE